MLTRHRVSLVMQSINNWTRAFGRQAMSKWPARVIMLHCNKTWEDVNSTVRSIWFYSAPIRAVQDICMQFRGFCAADSLCLTTIALSSCGSDAPPQPSPPPFVTLTQACPRLCSPIGRILSKLRKFSALPAQMSAELAPPFFRRSA